MTTGPCLVLAMSNVMSEAPRTLIVSRRVSRMSSGHDDALGAERVEETLPPQLAREHAHEHMTDLEDRAAVPALPRLRGFVEQFELERPRRAARDERVDAGGVGVEERDRVGVEGG